MNLKISEISQIVEGKLLGDGSAIIRGVSLDSRSVSPGDLFLAMKGQNTDGHFFLNEAFEKGALAALVEKTPELLPESWNLIVVHHTEEALDKLAKSWRDRFSPTVIAITGSAGKTTTKEMIATLLSSSAQVLKSEKNFNTQYGIPLTLFKLTKKDKFLLLELGLQEPGDVAHLTYLTRPNIGVITCIGPSHLQFLGSIDTVFKEKWELIKSLPVGGMAILNADDPYLQKGQPPTRINAFYFSLQKKTDFFARIIRQGPEFTDAEIYYPEGVMNISLPFGGKGLIYDFLASFAVAYLLGIPKDKIIRSLRDFAIPEGRGNLKILPSGLYVIDDSYNANPQSLEESIESFQKRATGRQILVLGDMLELGKETPRFHRQVGRKIGNGVYHLFLLGPYSKEIGKGAEEEGFKTSRIHHFLSLKDLLVALQEIIQPGDWILVKGSRGMHMEKIIEEMEHMKWHSGEQ